MEHCKRLRDLTTKENSRTLNHPKPKSTVFHGFQGLENAVVNLKHFQALQEPVRTLLDKGQVIPKTIIKMVQTASLHRHACGSPTVSKAG